MFKILRKDLLLILAVAAVFVSLSYAIGFVTDGSREIVEVQTAFLAGAHPKAQTTTVRVWRKPNFEKVSVLNSATLKSPEKMRAENSNVLVLDWSDLRFKEFSPEGKPLRTFGEEAGRPGAFLNPTSFSFDSAGNLWVCDLKQQRIGVLNTDGTERTIKPQHAPYQIAAIGDVMITMVTPDYNSLFETYDLSGKQLNAFGELLEDQTSKGLVLDGDIVADAESRGFIYGGRYLGVLAAYDLEGKQRFLMQTIDNVSQPLMVNIDGRMRKVKPNTARAILSLSLLDNELYVLSGVAPSDSGGKVMDVYNKQDGRYLYSWELPAAGQEAVVTSNYIYIRSNNEVTVWRFQSNT